MANIASGYVSIDSTDKEFLEDLKNKINDGPFSYGRPVDIIENPDGLSVYFKKKMPGSWEDAWVFFENLMASTDYAFQQALIESEINGQDCQGDRVAMVISKQSGEALITREDLSDEEDVAEKKLKQTATVVPIRPDSPQDLPLIDIFKTVLAQLEAEIDKASGFKFTSEKLNQSFDLEDLLDDQGNLKSNQGGTIFSWIEEFIKQDELISQRSFDEEEMMTLITFLIRGCAIYGHKKGLRIGGFIEYSTATEDNYIIDAVMKISFREDYSDLEIDVEMAELMVSSLSGEELSLLMREQLNEELKNNGVNKALYDSDKYVWLQTIKDTVNQHIKGIKSTKSSLIKEASEAKKASKPTDKAGANMTEEINIETIFKNMQDNPRPSPDWDVLHWERDEPKWSGLTYVAESDEYEEFQDNINDNGLYGVDKVGDKKWFGQGAVGIELIYENVEGQTSEEATQILGFRLSFQCGVQLAMGLVLIGEIYDGEFEEDSRLGFNFYNLETGSHDPADDSHGYWQEMYSDVQPVLEVEDDD